MDILKHSIEVTVKTRYLPEHSMPDKQLYAFAYTITIRNLGEIPAKLLARHWIITNADGEMHEVNGPGVVGEFPYLKPGEMYEYTSGAVINTPIGCMQGSYQMLADNGDQFYANIDPFGLSIPKQLH